MPLKDPLLELKQILVAVTAFAHAAAVVLSTIGSAYRRSEMSRFGSAALTFAFVMLTGSMAVCSVEAGCPPLTSLYGTLVFFAWFTVLVYIVVSCRHQVTVPGPMLVPAALIVAAVAARRLSRSRDEGDVAGYRFVLTATEYGGRQHVCLNGGLKRMELAI